MSKSSALWISALASLGALACSAADAGDLASAPGSGEDTTTLAQDLRGPAPASYLLLRRDVRRCAAPACGGFFVDPVNRDTLRCADGQRSEECYVADLDLSALALSPEQEALLRGEPTQFLVQGELRPRGSRRGSLADLGVSEAWHGHADTTPSGQFLRARNTGIVCITTPCPSLAAELLNRQEPAFSVAELDLSRVTEDSSAAIEQLNAPDGLLLAARRTTVTGTAGSARGLRASEFYVPFVAEQQSCGSRGQSQCADGSFCSFPADSDCGRADAPGTCAVRPQACIQLFKPVCGCDGKTYGNSCNAASAGVSVDFDGACDAPNP